MSAYNWIKVETKCPVCQKQVELRCQTHAASDYDGDQAGRFHDKEYRLGEPLRWWPKGHKNYPTWRVNGRIGSPNEGEFDWECCYTSCPSCRANLFALIQFDGPRSVTIEEIGLETNWPGNYKK
jgi:hypothetical protein